MRRISGRARTIGLVLLMTAALVATAAAQSNERIDELLEQEQAQLGHTAYLVLSAAGLVAEDASLPDSIDVAQENGWLGEQAQPGDPATFGAFSYLLTGSFNVPGGVMYRLVPGPRYAAREVVFQEWSRTRRAAGEDLSGASVVQMLSVFLNDQGGAQ